MIKRIALLTLLPFAALAHGDAAWIMHGPYLDKSGIHCCGPADCQKAEPGELKPIPGGWLHVPTGTAIPSDRPGVYPSIDLEMWRCVRGNELKCVFTVTGS